MLTKRNDLCPCDSGKKYKKCCQPFIRYNKVVSKATLIDDSILRKIIGGSDRELEEWLIVTGTGDQAKVDRFCSRYQKK